MSLASITSKLPSGLAGAEKPAPPADQGAAFERALKSAATKSPEELRAAATQLVSSAFIMPILSAMHESPFSQKGPFAPGDAEKRFAPLLDEKLADNITRKSNFPIIDSIVRRFTRAAAPAPMQSPEALFA